ncbi:hypothetical protein CEXT_213961 [Caerostris extrusa]|uniref:Uncharacterized protein n=1 Tax=Caerostris extrusa TaxID=172846 RepID=A0AAV4MGE2_CAEEX|nr:hypothetical protein CEXT_213961 [Caerostris extrusa]
MRAEDYPNTMEENKSLKTLTHSTYFSVGPTEIAQLTSQGFVSGAACLSIWDNEWGKGFEGDQQKRDGKNLLLRLC